MDEPGECRNEGAAAPPTGDIRDDACLLGDDPRTLFSSAGEMFAVPYADIAKLQLETMRRRFETLAPKVTMLGRLASQAGVDQIKTLEDGAALLYPSGIYKSYRLSWLEGGDFQSLTEWLAQFTTHDLSGVKADRASSLDQWFSELEEASELRVCHSSATSGKLSFVPRGEAEWRRRAATIPFADEAAGVENGPRHVSYAGLPILSPFYRSGHSAFLMSLDWNIRVYGDPSAVETLYPGHLSSDLLVLAAQLKNSIGEDDLPTNPAQFSLSPALTERWSELRELVSKPTQDRLAEFVETITQRFGGQPVWVIGPWPTLVDAAGMADQAGLSSCFREDSIIHTGGGAKGRDLSDDGYAQVTRWLGVREIRDSYGMSELMGANATCTAGKYHLNPWTVPYLFDEDGSLLERHGTQKGRFGAVDLMASSYWGGYMSTDAVTMTWERPCTCGRSGPYMEHAIERVPDIVDDKVSCAATPALHDDLVKVLAQWGK
jgi:hypothetical protein